MAAQLRWTVKLYDYLGVREGVVLGHIQAPHGSGKSTDLLESIWDRTQKTTPGRKVVYIQGTILESDLLCRYLTSQAFQHGSLIGKVSRDPSSEEKLCMVAMQELPQIGHKIIQKDMVLVLDAEVTQSAVGEANAILIRDLIVRLQAECAITIITLGCNRGRFLPFRGITDITGDILRVDVSRVNDQVEQFDPKDPDRSIEKMIYSSVLEGGRVLSFTSLAWTVDICLAVQCPIVVIKSTTAMEEIDHLLHPTVKGKPGCIIWVDAKAFSSALPLHDIRHVFISQATTTMKFDSATSLFVSKERPLLASEMLLRQSYVFPTTAPAHGARVFCDYDPKQLEPPGGVRGDYLGASMEEYVYHTVRALPGEVPYVKMPVAALSTRRLGHLSEMARRLMVRGLITPVGNGAKLTSKGEHLAQFSNVLSRNFGAACFLVEISTRDASPCVKRVAVRMAVLASLLSQRLALGIKIREGGSLLEADLEKISNFCAGPATNLLRNGYLWILLGAWEGARLRHNGFVPMSNQILNWVEIPELGYIDVGACKQAMREVETFEKVIGLPEMTPTQERQFLREVLTEGDIRTIESCIMWAWPSNLVMVPTAENEMAFDVLSQTNMNVLGDVFFDVESLLDRHRRGEGPVAGDSRAYLLSAMQFNGDDDEVLKPRMMTLISATLLKEFEDRLDKPAGKALASSCV